MEFLYSLAEQFIKGGFWMIVIFATLVASVAIAVERYIALYRKKKPSQLAYASEYEAMIRKGEIDAVYEKASADAGSEPLAAAVQAGAQTLLGLGGKDEIQGKMDEVLLAQNTDLDKRTGFLAMLANVATLTGLLGTIIGMIASFSAVTNASPTEKATKLADGIAVAMNTTAFGLIVAIPTLIVFSVLANRSQTLKDDLNQAGLKVFNWLSYSVEAVSTKTTSAKRTATRATTEANA